MNQQANERLMKKDDVIRRLMGSKPVQEKLDTVVREWSRRTESGKPEYTEEGISILRRVLEENGISSSILDEKALVNEISFFDNKYMNQPFKAREAGADRASEFMDTIQNEGLPEPDGLLTRTEEPEDTEDVITVDMKTSGSEPDVAYVEDESGKVYEIIYTSKNKMGTNFLSADYNPDAVDWNADTLEVAACAGLVMANQGRSPQQIMAAIEAKKGSENLMAEIQEERDKIIGILQNSGYDWEQSGVDEIIEKFQDNAPVHDFSRFLSIADGMYQFWEEVISEEIPEPQFIHGRITDYYEAERENENVETSGGKANTADFLVTSASADEVIELMKPSGEEGGGSPVSYTDNGVCYFLDNENVQFVQVSHKASFGGGSQLGKFVTDFRDVFGLPDKDNVLDDVVMPAQEVVMEEGVLDSVKSKFNQAAEFAENASEIFVNKVKGGFNAFKEKVHEMISTQVSRVYSTVNSLVSYFKSGSKAAKKSEIIVDRIRRLGVLNESELPANGLLLTESLTHADRVEIMRKAWNRLSPQNRQRVFEPVYRPINRYRDFVLDHMEGNNAYTVAMKPGEDFKPNRPDEIEKKDPINRIFGTYQAIGALRHMIQNEEDDIMSAKEVLQQFAGLQRRMHFGRTLLPLYKVSQSDYKFMGSGEGYEKKKVNFINAESSDDALHLVVLKLRGQPSESDPAWATTTFYIVDGIDEETNNFTYTRIELRTEGHELSFTISGKKSGIPQEQILSEE